jgi:ubiquinone/menaquinone biosynthesis C-methylase UbiE
MNKHYSSVAKYFNNKADEYDDVDQQLYWVLSDSYFKEILKKEVPKLFPHRSKIKILDAGAGTGRWSIILYELFHRSYNFSGHLLDISSKMLAVAEKKIKRLGLARKFTCTLANIEKMEVIPDHSYDLAISFYNVLSFVENPVTALREIRKKLKTGGYHISLVANKYHAAYFSILTGRTSELKAVLGKSQVRFNNDMPYIHCFSPQELRDLYKKSGYNSVRIIGGLNFMYPGMEETMVHGQTSRIRTSLAQTKIFERVLRSELKCYDREDIVGRGNILMAIAKK